MQLLCKKCNKNIGANHVTRHIDTQHNQLSDLEKILLYQDILQWNNSTKLHYLSTEFINFYFSNISQSYIEYCKIIRWYARSFNPFCNNILKYRQLSKTDVQIFFNLYLPYRKNAPKDHTSFKLAMIYCNNNKEEAQKFYDKVIKPRNPFTGHDGTLSPWSVDFIKYKNLSLEEKQNIINKKCMSKAHPDYNILRTKLNTCIEYYLNKGYSLEEAKQKLSQRQATNSLENYIKKYGTELGPIKFKEKLNSLQTSLNETKIKQYSKISQDLFNKIVNSLSLNKNDVFYAENNGEYELIIGTTFARLDFFIPSLNKWIEFDGDYWHKLKKAQKRDKLKEQKIKEKYPQIELKRIKEHDYRHNPDKILTECINWINNKG